MVRKDLSGKVMCGSGKAGGGTAVSMTQGTRDSWRTGVTGGWARGGGDVGSDLWLDLTVAGERHVPSPYTTPGLLLSRDASGTQDGTAHSAWDLRRMGFCKR